MLLLKQSKKLLCYSSVLRPVHTKEDHYDNCNNKCSCSEKNEVYNCNKNNYTEEQYLWNHFQNLIFKTTNHFFFQLMNAKHFWSQSESTKL